MKKKIEDLLFFLVGGDTEIIKTATKDDMFLVVVKFGVDEINTDWIDSGSITNIDFENKTVTVIYRI